MTFLEKFAETLKNKALCFKLICEIREICLLREMLIYNPNASGKNPEATR